MRRSWCGQWAAVVLIGVTAMTNSARADETPDVQRLLERIRVLEERLDKLERVEVIKKNGRVHLPGR